MGCASPGHLPSALVDLSWPPPPGEARIRYVGAFNSPADLGLEGGLGNALLDFIGGRETARLHRPYAIAVTGQSAGTGPGGEGEPGPTQLAVTDIGTNVVHLFDLVKGGHVVIEEAAEGRRLKAPVAVAFDDQGRLLVCDSGLRMLVRYRSDGSFDRILSRSFVRPAGLAVDVDRGVLFVADAGEHVVRRFDLEGRPLDDLSVRFRYPAHLAMASGGRLLVSDSMNFRVAIVSPAGELLGSIGQAGDASGDLQRPKGVAEDPEGHIYAVDALFDNVQIFDLSGRLLLAFGSAGDLPGELALPAGLAIDERGLIYVADTYNSRVQVFEYLRSEEKP